MLAHPPLAFVASVESFIAHEGPLMGIAPQLGNPQLGRMSGPVAQEIETLLRGALAPTRLDVINDSAKHYGHAGDDGSGESHFTVIVESPHFEGNCMDIARALAESPILRGRCDLTTFALRCDMGDSIGRNVRA